MRADGFVQLCDLDNACLTVTMVLYSTLYKPESGTEWLSKLTCLQTC